MRELIEVLILSGLVVIAVSAALVYRWLWLRSRRKVEALTAALRSTEATVERLNAARSPMIVRRKPPCSNFDWNAKFKSEKGEK